MHQWVVGKGGDCPDRSVWKALSPVVLWGWRGHQGKTSLSSLKFTCVLLAQCPSTLGDRALPASVLACLIQVITLHQVAFQPWQDTWAPLVWY